MYNESAPIMQVATSTAVTGAGLALLPATGSNNIGLILAIGAIVIGATTLIGQLVVRIVRRHYQVRTK